MACCHERCCFSNAGAPHLRCHHLRRRGHRLHFELLRAEQLERPLPFCSQGQQGWLIAFELEAGQPSDRFWRQLRCAEAALHRLLQQRQAAAPLAPQADPELGRVPAATAAAIAANQQIGIGCAALLKGLALGLLQ